KNSGHDGRQRETGVTVNRDDAGENGNKGAGWPTDLYFAATERGDDCPGNDRSPQTLRWRNPRSDAKTNRERQRDYADRYACGQVGEKSPPIVTAQTLDQFRFKKLHCSNTTTVIPCEVEESLTIFCEKGAASWVICHQLSVIPY